MMQIYEKIFRQKDKKQKVSRRFGPDCKSRVERGGRVRQVGRGGRVRLGKSHRERGSDGISSGLFLVIHQIKIHCSCGFINIFVGKTMKTTFLIKRNSIQIGIYCYAPASAQCHTRKNHLDLHNNRLTYMLIGIFPRYTQASNLHCRICMISLIVWNISVNLVPLIFSLGIKFNFIVEKTIICNGFVGLIVFKQICDSKHGIKIILGIIKKKAVQIGITTIKRLYLSVSFNLSECELFKIHNHIGKVLMAFNASYALRASSISLAEARPTVAIRSANRSASLPFKTGVSLIGLAISEDFYLFDYKGTIIF